MTVILCPSVDLKMIYPWRSVRNRLQFLREYIRRIYISGRP